MLSLRPWQEANCSNHTLNKTDASYNQGVLCTSLLFSVQLFLFSVYIWPVIWDRWDVYFKPVLVQTRSVRLYFLWFCLLFFSFLFFSVLEFELLGLNAGPTPWVTPPAPPPTFFVFFQDRVSQTICQGWLRTLIILISASWVARIIGVSHWHPAWFCLLREEKNTLYANDQD
jgi:hypothetical protein